MVAPGLTPPSSNVSVQCVPRFFFLRLAPLNKTVQLPEGFSDWSPFFTISPPSPPFLVAPPQNLNGLPETRSPAPIYDTNDRHNTATNEWTYNLGGRGVMMGVPPTPPPQIVGYVPAPAAPVGMYGWPVAAPAATVPSHAPILYGPPGAAVMPPAAGPYNAGAAQQMMYAQQMQQQQGMMAAYQQQQHHHHHQQQLQRSASDGGMFGGPPSMQQRSASGNGMFGGPPSMMGAAATAAGAGLAGGAAGYGMMPDANGPDAAAWIGRSADGSRLYPKSHKARGSVPLPFDPSHMVPAWFGGAAGAAAAGDAAGGPGGVSGFFGGMFPPGMMPPGMKGKKGKKSKKKEEEGGEEGDGGAAGDDSGGKDKAAAVSDDGNDSVAGAASDSDDDDDYDDADGGDVAKEVMASSAAAAAAAAGIAAAVARSDKEPLSPEGDELDQREPGGGGDGNVEEGGAGEAGKGVWVPIYDGDGGKWWSNTVTGDRLSEDPYV